MPFFALAVAHPILVVWGMPGGPDPPGDVFMVVHSSLEQFCFNVCRLAVEPLAELVSIENFSGFTTPVLAMESA